MLFACFWFLQYLFMNLYSHPIHSRWFRAVFKDKTSVQNPINSHPSGENCETWISIEFPSLSGLVARKERDQQGNMHMCGPMCTCTNGHVHDTALACLHMCKWATCTHGLHADAHAHAPMGHAIKGMHAGVCACTNRPPTPAWHWQLAVSKNF